MLGRKTYTQEELDHARSAIDAQLVTYDEVVEAAKRGGPRATAALEDFEPLFFNNLTLALDRRFVHRLRGVTGKDGNPLNEVELLSESLMNNEGIFRGNNVIKLDPARTVLKLELGDQIRLSRAQFEALYRAFVADIEAKFL